MICTKSNFVFVHIPKNAGTSVTTALYNSFGKLNAFQKLANRVSKRVYGRQIFKPVEKLGDHATASDYVEHLGDQYWSMLSFTFVRNPFDRLVSHYHYIQQTNHHHLYDRVHHLTFDEFISFVVDIPVAVPTQTSYILDKQGKCLVKKVGKVETISSDFSDICRDLNRNVKLKHVNKSEHRDFSDYFNEANTRIVADLFQQDFEAFGYSTDPSDNQMLGMKLNKHPKLLN